MKNKILNNKLKFYTLITILWIWVIFSFSLQSADESSELSGGIVAWIVSLICPEDFVYAALLEHFIRKAAHFTEYFILGWLLSLTIRETNCSKIILTPWCIGTVVACCDEAIQLFSDGRAGRLADVLLDSTGVLVAVLCFVKIMSKDKEVPNEQTSILT